MDNARVFRMAFASVYPHYIAKAEKKGRTKEEVHAIIHWLTGYENGRCNSRSTRRSTSRLSSPRPRGSTRTSPGSLA
ncbi:MAG: DUF2200 family protein [Bryobacteraceae bacterium]|nr:DUF2200 family protein [Bryobacteraceae bacterium]